MHEQQSLDENLIGYLLDALEPDAKAEVEAQLRAQPETRDRLDWLRHALEPLAADKAAPNPPSQLAVRTLARVAEFCCLELHKAPPAVARSSPQRSWWRRADLVAAAALFLLAVSLVLPAVLRSRQNQALVQCQDNLRDFHVGLQTYHDQHHQFPSVASEHPRDAAGMVVPILASCGVLGNTAKLRCPEGGNEVSCSLSLEQARALSPEAFFKQAGNLFPSYAYSLGYKDDNGEYCGPTVPEDMTASSFPLVADAPPADGSLSNSLNHGGAGQNILFADGHVRFVNNRTAGFQGDDIYLNKAKKVAAGVDPLDTVLGPSASKP
jgi:prepilin-type processing-associated H-X9-DG protein